MTVEALLTVEAVEGWSSLSNGLGKEEAVSRCHRPPGPVPKLLSHTNLHVTSKLSLMVPRSLMSTATTWGRAANRSLVSQETLPTTTWLARPFSSVTCSQECIMRSQGYRGHKVVGDQSLNMYRGYMTVTGSWGHEKVAGIGIY